MSYKVLERKLGFILPSVNLTGVATFEKDAVSIGANTPAGYKVTESQRMKDINDLYEAESAFRKCFNEESLAKGYLINVATCVFEGKVDDTPYRCTLQAVIPAGRAITLEATTSCLVSAEDARGSSICSDVSINVPYCHFNASLNKAENVVKAYLG